VSGGAGKPSIDVDIDVRGDRTSKRLRRWGTGLLQVGLVYSLAGVFGLYKAIPTQIDAAAIESGLRPDVWRANRRSYLQPHPYLIAGRLLENKRVAVPGMDPHICAPLISEGAGPAKAPSIYFLASAPDFERSRAEHRLVGRLSIGPSGTDTSSRIATACGVPSHTYLLLAYSADTVNFVWWVLIVVGILMMLSGLAARTIAARRARGG